MNKKLPLDKREYTSDDFPGESYGEDVISFEGIALLRVS